MTAKSWAPGALVLTGLFSICSCMRLGEVSQIERVHGCEYEFLAAHRVGAISSLSDLPKKARSKLEGALKRRMGDRVYSRLRVAGGEIVEAKPQSGEHQDSVVAGPGSPAYLLYFLLPADDGSEGYCLPIPLDADGRVLGPIHVPSTATDPQKARIISKSSALAIAVAHGAPAATTWAEMVYVTPCDCLEWVVSYPNGRDGAAIKMLNLHINAHDPQKISWSGSELNL